MKHGLNCLAGALLLVAGVVHAQPFPSKPVRIIAAFTAGSTIDIMARIIAPKLSSALGQQVIVENRVGAGGSIGYDATAKAAKDGYTMTLAASGLAILPGLNPRLPWDPIKDFAPVTQVAVSPLVILVHPNVPARNLQELIALGKAQPGKLRYGHAGVGSSQHMAGQLFGIAAGIEIGDVPYKGNEEALTDLIGARLEINFQGIPTVLSQIRSGAVRAIVVTGPKRSARLPEIPTIGEAGLPSATVNVWFGLLAPAGTPREIITRLNSDIVTLMKSQDVTESFTKSGAEVTTSTPDEFARMIRDDVETWAKVIKQRGIKID